ncbi:putative Ig domain-containing protein [Agromyces sp. NPDC057679]|uniref:putative Ig domain-containing protein n=1 Tax=Agromyces sp. NPDC057679 TaxID=3346207 RepID=UPI0036729F47
MRQDRRAVTTITALLTASTFAFAPAAAASAAELPPATEPPAPESQAPDETAIVWGEPAGMTFRAGDTVSWAVPVTGASSILVSGLPDGLVFDGQRIIGTITSDVTFQVSALSPSGSAEVRLFAFTVLPQPPVWQNGETVTVSGYDPVDVQFLVFGADTCVLSSTLPAGFTFTADCRATGTAAPGTPELEVVITAINAGGSSTKRFVIRFDWTPRFTAPTLTAGAPAAGQSFVFHGAGLTPGASAVTVTDQDGREVASIDVTVDELGTLNASVPVPTPGAGAYRAAFTAAAADGTPVSWALFYSIDTAGQIAEVSTDSPVQDPLPAPVWVTEDTVVTRAGEEFTVTLSATDAAEYAVQGLLPDGARFDQDAGTITGTFDVTGEHRFTVVASNRRGSTAQEFIVTVNPAGLVTLEPLFTVGTATADASFQVSGSFLDLGTVFTIAADGKAVLEITVPDTGDIAQEVPTGALNAGMHRFTAEAVALGEPVTATVWVDVDRDGLISGIYTEEPERPDVPDEPGPVNPGDPTSLPPKPAVLDEITRYADDAEAVVELVPAPPMTQPTAVKQEPGFTIDGVWLFAAGVAFAAAAAFLRRDKPDS